MSESLVVGIGLVAGTLTTISFLPQVVQTIKTRHTKDISLTMYIAFTLGILMWLIYGIMLDSPPIYLANGVTLIFAAIILFLKLKHG